MNLLDANDQPGTYPPSWYAATAAPLPELAPLRGEARADVCIVGGGYTGLSSALHLAQRGVRVVLLEAQLIGFGASGRNGGQVGSGMRLDQDALDIMSQSIAIQEVLGPEFCSVYESVQRNEFKEFLQVISPWERQHLLLNV